MRLSRVYSLTGHWENHAVLYVIRGFSPVINEYEQGS